MTTETSLYIIDVGCPDTLLPKPGDIAVVLKNLANLPVKLLLAGFSSEIQQIKQALQTIDELLGNFPISVTKPVFEGFDIPEYEWELRARGIVAEFKLYAISKMLEIIESLIPNILIIPVPFLGNVNILQLFTDTEYRAFIRAKIAANITAAAAIAGKLGASFSGLFGVKTPELQAQEIWSWFIMEMTNIATRILHTAFSTLIGMFRSIWNALHLPALIDLLTIDIETLIQNAIDSVSDVLDIESYRKALIAALESINIAGFNLLEIAGYNDVDDVVISAELKINRLISAAKDFAVKYPLYLLEQWMFLVKAFFNAIGLGALLTYIPFTFCSFLTLIGFPTSFAPYLPEILPITLPVN